MKRFNLMIGIIAFTCAGVAVLYWPQRIRWPDFPATVGPEPQIVAQVEPDFAWRVGDLVPLTIFIKQQPGTIVDQDSLAFAGDFEIARQPEIYIRDYKDGSRHFSIKLVLQSFQVTHKLGLRGNLAFRVGENRETKVIDLPEVDLYTSRTWDGRPDIQDGPLAAVHGWHVWITALWLVGGIAGVIYALILHRRARRAAKELLNPPALTARQQARAEFEKVWKSIESGEDLPAHYKRIEQIVRALYRIESRTLYEVRLEIGDNHPHLEHILQVMQVCGLVLYANRRPSQAHKKGLKGAFDSLVPAVFPPG